MTKQEFMKNVLRGHPRTNDAIYWYCQAWHSGDDDLYKIMCSLDFTPRPWSDNPMIADATGKLSANPNYDPVLVNLLSQLDAALVPGAQTPLRPVRLREVQEGHVLTVEEGAPFACMTPNWPSRVYRHHGVLGVQCSGGLHGVKLLPGSETTFHPLTEDKYGFVVGFQR